MPNLKSNKHNKPKRNRLGLYAHTVAAMTCRVQENPRETADRIRWLTNFRKPRLWVSLCAALLVIVLAVLCLSGRKAVTPMPPAADMNLETQAAQVAVPTPYTGQIGFLMVGTDGRADRAPMQTAVMSDLIAYVSWDCDTGKVEILQIPARLYVGMEYALADGTTYTTMNEAVNSLAANNAVGLEALCRTVENMLALPVAGYVSIDMDGLTEIVDYVGGIEVNLPRKLEYAGSSLPQGSYLLNGDSVEFLMCNRKGEGYDYGELDRMEMQRCFYAGVLRYVQTCTPVDAAKLIPVLLNHMQTTFDADTMIRLLTSMEGVRAEDVTFSQLPVYPGATTPDGNSCAVGDPDATAALLNAKFRAGQEIPAASLRLASLTYDGPLLSGKSEALNGL